MRKSGGRPRVRPYTWMEGVQGTPGAMVGVPRTGRMVFLAADDLARIADGLVDVMEEIEAERGEQ